MNSSLLETIGGEEGVAAAVSLFYKKMINDADLVHFFDGMDVEKIKSHQREFFTALLGGESNYNGRDLRTAHKSLVEDKGLNDHHFDLTAQHLHDTLRELGVDEQTSKGLMLIIGAMRDDVLNRE